jgi:thiamine-phosphate pyrophosphorylase
VPGIDLSLYAILDRSLPRSYSLEDFTRLIIEGGVSSLQVRLKDEATRSIMDFTSRVLRVARSREIPVIVNDRVDVALAAGAAGVHLGNQDMAVRDARRIGGSRLVIGATVRDLESARQAEASGADYLGVGAVFATPVKPELEPIPLDILDRIRQEISLPIVAIGGINQTNAALPIKHGANGVAVISALRQCLDPKEAAARLRAAVEEAKKS